MTLEDFTAEERDEIFKWKKILDEWQHYRNSYPGKKTEVDDLFISKYKLEHPELTISTDILYRKYKAYKQNDLAGILGKRGGSNKGKSTIHPIVWKQFSCLYLSETEPTVARCVDLTKFCMMEYHPELVDGIPSVKTFQRHVKSDLLEAIKIYLKEGTKALRDKCLPYLMREYGDLEVNDCWIADNHTIDVESISEETGKPHRLYLTSFMDAKSGIVVGWNITDTVCSQSTLIALRHAIIRFGKPRAVYFDNGREFLTHDIAGMGHRKRGPKDAEPKFEPIPILDRLDIEMHNAIPTNAKAKPIERSYCTLTKQFSKAFTTGYTGGNIMERPESHEKYKRKNKLPCDYEVRESIAEYIDYDFNMSLYGGYESKFEGMTRLDVWNQEIKRVGKVEVPEDILDLMLMRITRPQKVKRNGVKVKVGEANVWFYDPENTFRYLGQEVYVRYDPADLTSARIYDNEDRFLFVWKNADKLIVDFITKCKEELSDAMAIQRRVERHIINLAKETIGNGEDTVDMMEAMAVKAAHNKKHFNIAQPEKKTVFEPDPKEFGALPKAAGDYEYPDITPSSYSDDEVYLDNLIKSKKKG